MLNYLLCIVPILMRIKKENAQKKFWKNPQFKKNTKKKTVQLVKSAKEVMESSGRGVRYDGSSFSLH